MGLEQLVDGVELPFPPELTIPELHPLDLGTTTPSVVDDVERAAYDAAIATLAIDPGMTVAVGAGSRGLRDRIALLRGAIAGVRALGGDAFVVPAMGSHGGATPEGQRRVLADLGITEATLGAEIRATMDTVVVAHTDDGLPVHLDAHAAAADRLVPVNRIKPHTSFRGPFESGCAKMAVVGFGKQPGAQLVHTCGPVEMRARLIAATAALRGTGRLAGGIATIESATGGIALVEGLRPDDVGAEREIELTELARAEIASLPFDEIDVLVVERGGKEISGTAVDPNVTGRFWLPGLDEPDRPRIGAIVLLELTAASHGNALGVGFADVIPAALAAQIDFRTTYLNGLTTGPPGLRRTRLPMVLPDEDACLKAAIAMCGRGPDRPLRMVRIESTLHPERCRVSTALLPTG